MKSVLPFNNKFDIPVKVAEGGTGATTATEATNNLFAQSLAPDVDIPSNSDLNNYDTPGCYRIPDSDCASSITNTPIIDHGYMLTVYSTYGIYNNLARLQIAMGYYGITYTRYRDNDGIWHSWTQRKYTDTTYGVATTSANGLMSKEDKTKVDGLVPSTTTPKVAGTAAVGSETEFSRGDHVHPAQTSVSGNAGSATKLATARSVDGVSFNGTANITHFGTCSTDAATVEKTVELTGFTLTTGAELTVKFTVTNTEANPTLNVNSTGAKPIYYRGAAISAGYLASGRTYRFSYDGTSYNLIGDLNTNTTYSNMTAATASTAGKAGLVPAPAAGKQTSFLRGDGTWVVPTNTTYGVATTSANGLMSKEDKTKLDNIAKSSSTSKLYMCGVASAGGTVYYNSSVYASGSVLYGAAWNDYAEFREITEDKIPYGKVLVENGDDTLSISTERLQPGGNICSDTFGFAIGETKKAKAPLAVSGRVLAYPYEARDSYKPGDAVCSGPNGTVSKMTREEIKEYPDRIIGFVSAIPNYEVWGEDNIKVNGRIWIKVK